LPRTKTEKSKSPTLKGVTRALDVLDYVATNPGRAIDIAEGLKVSWATLHRTLSQLEAKGFLNREAGSNRYTIGPRMWLIGTSYLADHAVLEAAHPYLSSVAERSAFTVQLTERSGRMAVVLYSRDRTGQEITQATYGFHFPLHCGSKGQVLLAYAGQESIEEYLAGDLERLTAETITDPDELRRVLEQIRIDGYRLTQRDVQPHTGSIAAPVFDRDGAIVASISFISRYSYFDDESKFHDAVDTLIQTAHSASIAIGWKPGKTATA
jgi:DNA-binding IclR family transcriptional regulator